MGSDEFLMVLCWAAEVLPAWDSHHDLHHSDHHWAVCGSSWVPQSAFCWSTFCHIHIDFVSILPGGCFQDVMPWNFLCFECSVTAFVRQVWCLCSIVRWGCGGTALPSGRCLLAVSGLEGRLYFRSVATFLWRTVSWNKFQTWISGFCAAQDPPTSMECYWKGPLSLDWVKFGGTGTCALAAVRHQDMVDTCP